MTSYSSLTFERLKLFEVDLNTAIKSRSWCESGFRWVGRLSRLLRLGYDLLGLVHLVGNVDGLIGLRFYNLKNGVSCLLNTYDV